MTEFDPFPKSDDLSSTLTAPVRTGLPQDEAFVRIRASVPEFVETCPKCRGTGRFVSYSGRPLGPCFACKGRGSNTFKTSRETRMANREKTADRKARQQGNNWQAFVENYPALAEVLTQGIAQTWGDGRWNGICADIKGKVERYGDLHQGTMDMLQRSADRAAARAAQRAEATAQQQEQVKGIDVANIADCFQRAHEAGLKRFTLRFAEVHFQVDRRDPTLIWVSKGGYGTAKYGRIQGGAYKPGRDTTAEVIAQIAEISKDPMAAAMAYAQLTSECSVCGRHLENKDSVDAGIGPVCAGRINRPGLKFVPVGKGDF